MLINQTVVKELYEEAGEARFNRAKEYVKEGKVDIQKIDYDNMNNFSVTSIVQGNNNYKTSIEVKNGEIDNVTCECQDYKTYYGACKHIISTIMEVDGNPKYNGGLSKVKEKYTDFSDLINTFYKEEIELLNETEDEKQPLFDTNVKLVPKLIYDKYAEEMKIEFKIGTKKQLYRLRDLSEFYDNMMNKRKYKYGVKLYMIHDENSFDKQDIPLLNFILKHAETIKYINSNSNSIYRYYGKVLNTGSIVLGNTILDEIFEILKNKTVELEKDYNTYM